MNDSQKSGFLFKKGKDCDVEDGGNGILLLNRRCRIHWLNKRFMGDGASSGAITSGPIFSCCHNICFGSISCQEGLVFIFC